MNPMSDSDSDYTFIYPHPDHLIWGSVALSQHAISKRNMSYFIEEAAKRYPAIPINPTPTVYKPSGLRRKPRKTLLERTRQWLKEHHEDDSEDVLIDLHLDIISEVLPEGRDRNYLDVIIVTPEIIESLDEIDELQRTCGKVIRGREAAIRSAGEDLPSPSSGVKSSAALKSLFTHNGDIVHAGRPAGNDGPPVALFDPALGLLAYRLSHLDDDLPEIRPGHTEYKLAHQFIDMSLANYDDEDLRLNSIKAIIQSLLPNVTYKTTMNGLHPGIIWGAANGFPGGLAELTNEVGLGGDASIQARLSYTRIVIEDKAETIRIRKQSNCPAVLIGIMGDVVEIAIAVWTDGSYSDFVFSSGRMRLGHHQNAHVLRIARAFKAVKLALADLKHFYEQLHLRPPPAFSIRHLFPWPIPEPSWHGRMPALTFTHRMSPSGELFLTASTNQKRASCIYVGTMTMRTGNPESASSPGAAERCVDVVIKFTASDYNEHSHRLLASVGFAPALHACVPVCGSMKMVVMDRVQGETAWRLEKQNAHPPSTVFEDVQSAIKLLHSEGLVFGDLRLPNIMCVSRASASASGENTRMGAMLVDFDWVGKADEARYPAVLNDDLGCWAAGVERGGIMRKEHDLYMLQRVQALCSVPA